MALLIDADIIAYQAVSNAQSEVEFEPDVWQIYCNLQEARTSFEDQVQSLLEKSEQKSYLLCFSDPEGANFRKQLAPGQYKANRSSRKPVGYRPFVQSIRDKMGKSFVSAPRLEADDVMGIMSTRHPGRHVIWSLDKDMKQIPGAHLIDGEVSQIDEYDGTLFFYKQVLTGDQVDNYPGCPGIGPVKADKILAKVNTFDDYEVGAGGPNSYWEAILNTYVCAGLTEADALLQARLAFILRDTHYNRETGKVKLWKPTS